MRSRGLPDDHAGPVRVVDIEGIDSNMCCGTHVSNLSDLQVGLQPGCLREPRAAHSGLAQQKP